MHAKPDTHYVGYSSTLYTFVYTVRGVYSIEYCKHIMTYRVQLYRAPLQLRSSIGDDVWGQRCTPRYLC